VADRWLTILGLKAQSTTRISTQSIQIVFWENGLVISFRECDLRSCFCENLAYDIALREWFADSDPHKEQVFFVFVFVVVENRI